MEESQIPKLLLEKYNVYKEDDLKYSSLKIKDFENEYIKKENSMIDSLTSLKKSLELILEKISEIILNNKNTFNDTCSENEIKSLDYIMFLKITLYFISQIISKLENKEIEAETFKSIFDKLSPQFSKIIEVQYPQNNPSLLSNIENYVKEVLDYSTKIKDSTNKPGIILTTLVKYLELKLVKNTFDSIDKFNEIKDFKDTAFFNNQTKTHEMILFDLCILLKRIKNLSEFLYFSYMLDENDLDNKYEKTEEWDDIKKLLWTVKPKKDIDVEKIITELTNKMQIRMSQMRKMREEGPKFGAMVGNMVNNFFNSTQAEYEYKKVMMKPYGFAIQPPNKTMKMNSMMKKMISTRLPSIECRKKLYIRREFKPITLDYIKELNNFLNGKITEPSDKSIFLDNYKLPENISNKKLFSTKLEKNEKDDYVSTRIMNGSTLLFKGEKLEEKTGFFGFGQKKEQNIEHKNEFKNTLFIHINGGGFKSNNGFMMERFLRVWSKDLGVALMTIKKPEKEEDKFPATLNEFYQVYMWLINHAKDELNMDIQKIIISGDSAGGGLCFAFTNLIIGINLFENKNIKIPDLVLLEYPNLSFDLNRMGIGLCLGASENFYNHAFFRNLVNYYLGEFNDYHNMFVSPLYTSDKIKEILPKIRFFFGNQDVSRDEFLRGMYNLKSCKDIRGYNFLNLGHAFNGIDNKDIFEMVKDFIIEEVKTIL